MLDDLPILGSATRLSPSMEDSKRTAKDGVNNQIELFLIGRTPGVPTWTAARRYLHEPVRPASRFYVMRDASLAAASFDARFITTA
jgi:hypothetical protein